MIACVRSDPVQLSIVVPDGYRGPIAIIVSEDGTPVDTAEPVRWELESDGHAKVQSLEPFRVGAGIRCNYADGTTLSFVNPSDEEVALRGGDVVSANGEAETLRYFVGTRSEYDAFSYEEWRDYLREVRDAAAH